MTVFTKSLSAKFDDLHAERERTWPRDKLDRNIAQREALVAAFDPKKVVQAGDRVGPFTLEWSDGGSVTLDELTAHGPVLLIFFRFAGCPACNIALPHHDETLRPALEAVGVRLVAVSPHLPEKGLGAIAVRHGLGYPVASDRSNALARRFGLAFEPSDAMPVPGDNDWIGALTGLGTWELPQAATILIDGQGIVRFSDVSPDWLRRTEAKTLIAAAQSLTERKAA